MKLPNKNKIRDHFIFISTALLLAFLISGCNDDTVGLSVSSTSVKSLEASDSDIVSSGNSIPAVPSESKYMTLASDAGTGISVLGESTISVKPDIAILDIGVETFAESVALARQSAAQEMGSVISALKKQGVDDSDIQTNRLNISPSYDYEEIMVRGKRTGRQVLTGYFVNNVVKVRIRELEKAGEVIDRTASAGGDSIRINGISFTVDDLSPYKVLLRKGAVEDSLVKANHYATESGVTLGPLISLSETIAPAIQSFQKDMAFGMRAMSESMPTSVSGGELDIHHSIQATFAIN